jgi:hypothetical protein
MGGNDGCLGWARWGSGVVRQRRSLVRHGMSVRFLIPSSFSGGYLVYLRYRYLR